MLDLKSLMESWNSPPTRHAMLVHFPIVLALAGACLALLAGILPRNKTVRGLAILCQIALIAAAFITVNSGDNADNAVKVLLTRDAQGILNQHQEMAEKVWMFGVGCLLLLSLGVAMKKPALSATFTWLAAAGTIATFLWIGKTANYGGQLVYHHGVGTPQPLVRDTGGIEPPGLAMSRGIATSRAAPPPATAPASQAAAPASSPTTVAAGVPPGPTDPLKVAFFREKVYPILSQNCFNCHNPNRARRSGGLDQTTRETIVKGGRSGPAVVPGKPEDSVLVHRIRGDDPDVRIMPPSGQLSDDEIAVIAKWIQDGAAWGATAPVERGSG